MPGQPPRVHSSGFQSLKNILFFYDPQTETVVVGPRKFNQKQQSWIDLGTKTVPEVLEHGDAVTIREESRDGRRWRHRRQKKRPGVQYRKRRAIYKPRPFMAVGLREEIAAGTIPKAWSNVVRG